MSVGSSTTTPPPPPDDKHQSKFDPPRLDDIDGFLEMYEKTDGKNLSEADVNGVSPVGDDSFICRYGRHEQ